MSESVLTDALRLQYDEQGFLLVPRLFDAAEREVWERRFRDIVEEVIPPAKDMLVMRDVMVAKGAVAPRARAAAIAKIQDFHHDPVLFDGYACNPKLLAWVEAFVGRDVKSIHNMLINKPPGVDGRHPLHQDLLYFPFRPAEKIVATWTALEPCTRENGCLVVVPGSQRGELLDHENPGWEHVNYMYVAAKGVGAHPDRIHIEMEPGDTLFFHPLLLHGSGRNRSDGYRRAISAHFASSTCQYLRGMAPVDGRRPYVLVRGEEYEGCI